jgi:hypothetical protein
MKYSEEPARTPLLAHYTFDSDDLGVDASPQANDTQFDGEVAGRGINGPSMAIERTDGESVLPDALTDAFPRSEFTATMWTYIGGSEPSPAVEAVLDFGDSAYTLTAESTEGDWLFAALWYDGSDARLYVGSNESDPKLRVKESYVGDVESFSLRVNAPDTTFTDDVRLARTALPEDDIDSIWRVAAEPTGLSVAAQRWDNDAMPLWRGNSRLLGVLSERTASTLRNADAIDQARFVTTAAGVQLDRIGRGVGVRRKTEESDARYRARIIGSVAARQSAATVSEMLSLVQTVVDAGAENIAVDRYDGIANATVQIPNQRIQAADLTASDLTDIFDLAAPAGHTITVQATRENAFTLKGEGEPDDPSLGLSGDTVDGGVLIEQL